MPVYEFYCFDCNTIYNFYSRSVNLEKRPPCPGCDNKALKRMVSRFATTSGADEDAGEGMPDIDESKLESAMGLLAGEAEKINEDDPRQAANLMRKFTEMTGMNLGDKMEEALGKLEAGEDPEAVEAEMGDLLDDEEPFKMKKIGGGRGRGKAPSVDKTIYEL